MDRLVMERKSSSRPVRSSSETSSAGGRRPDPQLAAHVRGLLGDAGTIMAIGDATYVPTDREVTVLPAIGGGSRDPLVLPLSLTDASVDAAFVAFPRGEGEELDAALREIRRVTRARIVLLTWDPLELTRSWLAAYAPELMEVVIRATPSVERLVQALGADVLVEEASLSGDAVDGTFIEAALARPERLLESAFRAGHPGWSCLPKSVIRRFTQELAGDLRSGAWDRYHGHLRALPTIPTALRVIVSL